MSSIDAAAWDALVGDDAPHMRHRFLDLAERSGSVDPATGWAPCHITIAEDDDIVAAMPLYQKSHSWGEFVFDWSWADAYRRAGLEYYPKLVSAAPFTPATASKLLVRAGRDDASALRRTLLQVAESFAREHAFSSLHLQFLDASDVAACREQQLLVREDCQFHWHNRGYASFDDFLDTFASKKRKNVRRERRRIIEAGITHDIVAGADITEHQMRDAWRLCSYTFALRGHQPYLNEAFFQQLREHAPEALVLVLASRDGVTVAAAILLRGNETLLGRYWGSEGDFHSLHFETCYYQGIDYCIREGLQRFEPGTQGEHKVSRGFLPVRTASAHWLAHPQFADAIADYLEREAAGVRQYMAAIDARSPYRQTGGDGQP